MVMDRVALLHSYSSSEPIARSVLSIWLGTSIIATDSVEDDNDIDAAREKMYEPQLDYQGWQKEKEWQIVEESILYIYIWHDIA